MHSNGFFLFDLYGNYRRRDRADVQRVEKLSDNITHCFVVANDFDIVVMGSQTVGSLRVLFVTSVRPPLDHVAQLVVKSANVVIIMR